MSNPARKTRDHREEHPDFYCPRCLWRVKHNGRPDTPCPKHMVRAEGGAA